MAADTGLGFTLTALPGSWTGNLISAKRRTATIPTVPTSHLGTTTNETKLAGDLIEPGDEVLTVEFDGSVALPAPGTTGTLTLTEAVEPGDSTAADETGTAIVTSVDWGERAKNTLKIAVITVSWDGLTGPTYTAAT